MSKDLALAVIGAGRQAKRLAAASQSVDGLALKVIATVPETQAQGQAMADALGCRLSLEPEAVVIDPDIDAVFVCTPNSFHEPYTAAALGAGKQVMVDKPLAHNLESAQRMVDAAKASGCLLKAGFNFRHRGPIRQALAWLAEGRIGDLLSVKAQIGHGQYFNPEAQKGWFCEVDVAGGGACLDIGIHAIDLANQALAIDAGRRGHPDQFDSVFAEVSRGRVIRPEGTTVFPEEEAHALFTSGNGLHFNLSASWIEQRKFLQLKFILTGSEGLIEAEFGDSSVTLMNGIGGDHRAERMDIDYIDAESWISLLKGFVSDVSNEKANRSCGDGLFCQKQVEGIYTSAEEGRRVEV